MALFKRKSKSKKPKRCTVLDDASGPVNKAVEIIYRYKWDKDFVPTEAELHQFRQLTEIFESARATAQYLYYCMQKRSRGEPEGSDRYTDQKKFDYHYPP